MHWTLLMLCAWTGEVHQTGECGECSLETQGAISGVILGPINYPIGYRPDFWNVLKLTANKGHLL
jgi:hypothetical protein